MRHPLRALFIILLFATPLFAKNPIQIENEKVGHPEWVLQRGTDNREIEGYTSATSINRGESFSVYVNTGELNYQLEVFRMGWYNGAGARRVHGPVTLPGTRQVTPSPDPTTGLVECNWINPYTITTNDDWTSGIFLVKLTAIGSNRQSYVPIIVRDDSRFSNHYYQASVTTWQAYNSWGGKSLYPDGSTDRKPAVKVSFDRPYANGDGTGHFLWYWEYNMVRFLEREGYDVTYSTNLDTARRPSLLTNHESFLSVGHDEYWSWEMRQNVIAARDAGIDIGIFSANTCYWQIRHEANASGVADRRIVSYKEQALQRDPFALDNTTSNNHLITTRWRDTPVNLPEASFLGVQYVYNTVDTDIVIDDVTSAPWVFEGTGLTTGSKLVGLLGYEVDAIIPNVSPANIIRLGNSPYINTKVTPNRTEYSQMTVYTAPSGAMVFATGSIQWSWGLDSWHNGANRVSPAAQQLTRNVLRRFAGSRSANDCLFTFSPIWIAVTPAAQTKSFTISSQTGCAWSATSSAPWVSVIAGSTGSGNGTVTLSFQANPGAARQAVINVGNTQYQVFQDSGCSFSVSPISANYTNAGGTGSLSVTASHPSCPWDFEDNMSWVRVTGVTTTVGSGTLNYAVDPNPGPRRSGRILIDPEPGVTPVSFPVSQDDGCTYNVSPSPVTVPLTGGSTPVNVAPSSELCFWTAATNDTWLSVSPGSGRGSAAVNITATASATPRTGSVWIAGREVRVNQQDTTCTFTISPKSFTLARLSSTQTISVSSSAGCTAAATTNVPWITINNGFGGGNGSVTFTVALNATGAQRSGSITIAGQTIPVTQGRGAAMPHTDFDGDGQSDIFFRNAGSGQNAIWLMRAADVKTAAFTTSTSSGWSVAGIGDFNAGSGKADVLWRGPSGEVALWIMNGTQMVSSSYLPPMAPEWRVEAVADFSNDQTADVLWRNTRTHVAMVWLMNQGTVQTQAVIAQPSAEWVVQGAGDFNADGKADILWRNSRTFESVVWLMDGAAILTANYIATPSDIWSVKGIGDFNGDGRYDILWRSTRNETVIWFMNGLSILSTGFVTPAPGGWEIGAVGEYNGDGYADLVWRNQASGENAVWFLQNTSVIGSSYLPTVSDPNFFIAGPR